MKLFKFFLFINLVAVYLGLAVFVTIALSDYFLFRKCEIIDTPKERVKICRK